MYCDRSAYYQKAIKATARQLLIYSNLLWIFLLFGRLIFDFVKKQFFNNLNDFTYIKLEQAAVQLCLTRNLMRTVQVLVDDL